MRDLTSDKITFLGLEIEKRNKEIYINQRNLIEKVISHFGMDDCKISKIPVEPKLNLEKGPVDNNLKVPYKELVGSLMYLMLGSRPDLCFVVSYFGRFQNCFTETHWKHLKNVIRYLKYTVNFGLCYSSNNDSRFKIDLKAYVDSDYASDINDRKSVSGFVILINNNVVGWCSKKQSVVAQSSSESEFLAMSACMSECLFLSHMLEEILMSVYPIYVYEDNQGCIKMAHTYETKRTKHIDVKHHFVKDMVNEGKFKIVYVPTNEQLADIMTKALPLGKFEHFRNKLVINISV